MSHDRRHSWEELYRSEQVESLPWFYPGLDPDFAAALKKWNIRRGEMLDLCTGPGTQALAMAERGFSVTAADIAGTAVKQACLRASELGMDIVFRQNDILDSHLDREFDIIFDRGCYHVFHRRDRERYVPAVARLLKPEGVLLLKCFSNLERRREGPYRIAPEELRELFAARFDILAMKHTVFQSLQLDPEPKALFCVMKKRRQPAGVEEGFGPAGFR